MATITAFRMDGLGNDFLIIDRREKNIHFSKEKIIELADRKKIGFDQIIFLEKEENNTTPILIFNSDGNEVAACGNGTRCVSYLLGKEKNFWLSISATTREPREGEKDGENYYFLNQEKFKEMIEQNLFLEWAQFAGNYYGTPLSSVNEKIKKGFTVLLEIEVEGARQIKNKFPNSLSIFLLPPDKEELERRIRNRGTEKEEAIKKRLSRANYEISVSNQFDFALTNHNVDETAKKIIKLIKT